jgi:pullulanase/glycogen debranching enzyme
MGARRTAREGKSMNSAARIGSSSPLGATIIEGGANFSLFSRGATGVELLFFNNESDARPSRVHIDPAANRTYHYWHVFVPGVKPGQIYGYRVQGASNPSKGMRFDPTKVLLSSLVNRSLRSRVGAAFFGFLSPDSTIENVSALDAGRSCLAGGQPSDRRHPRGPEDRDR